jgi:hypothetical protein
MLFDHEPTIQAILYLDIESRRIQGHLYQRGDTTIYLMDCNGIWKDIKIQTNPFYYHLDDWLQSPMFIGDRETIPWDILCDYLQDGIPRINGSVALENHEEESKRIKYEMFDQTAKWIFEKRSNVLKILKTIDSYDYYLGEQLK